MFLTHLSASIHKSHLLPLVFCSSNMLNAGVVINSTSRFFSAGCTFVIEVR